jgi:hypothetical protein
MRIWIGKSLIIIGIIHSIFGFIVFHNIIADLVREMLFNSINSQLDRNTAFWFLFTGFAIIIIGGLIDWAERKHSELPSFLKWSFVAITVLGCFIMPKSGFWLLFIPTIGLLLRRNK